MIADTFHIKPKQSALICKNDYGWFICDKTEDGNYLHNDGSWYETMSSNGQYHYHPTEQSAIDLCEKYNYNYVVDREWP